MSVVEGIGLTSRVRVDDIHTVMTRDDQNLRAGIKFQRYYPLLRPH